jgi:hypothetical protein
MTIPSFNNPREHLLFQRQQSRIMQEAEWENRLAIPKSVAWFALAFFEGAVAVACLVAIYFMCWRP